MEAKKILLIDDDIKFCNDLIFLLKNTGHCEIAHNFESGLKYFKSNKYDLIILDIDFGTEKDGLDLLAEIRRVDKITPIIMITKFEDLETVVLAMKKGANDYLKKPLDFKELQIRIQKVFKDIELYKENTVLKEKMRQKRIPFFGESIQIKKIKANIPKIANSDAPVLITGETGVGKEILAREIHLRSSRKDRPFFVINCSALPENTIESELFGHEKGAFTGAIKTHLGKLEIANGSSLLIDEIAELNLDLQVKLLNVLESQQFCRLGSNKEVKTDIRFLFATNKNLYDEIESKKFREDLFYRINVFSIEIPPLRERPEDIEQIIDYYLDIFCTIAGKDKMSLTKDTIEFLKQQQWPGNIRQLKNILEKTSVLSEANDVDINFIKSFSDFEIPKEENKGILLKKYENARNIILKNFQKEYITFYLRKTNGQISEAARLMGINRASLHRMLNELNKN